MWLRPHTSNLKFKQNTHTQDADGIQGLSELYDTVKGKIPTIVRLIGGLGAPSLLPLKFLKRKPFDISHRSCCEKFIQ